MPIPYPLPNWWQWRIGVRSFSGVLTIARRTSAPWVLVSTAAFATGPQKVRVMGGWATWGAFLLWEKMI